MQLCSKTFLARIAKHSMSIVDPLMFVLVRGRDIRVLLTEVAKLRTAICVAGLVRTSIDI